MGERFQNESAGDTACDLSKRTEDLVSSAREDVRLLIT